MVKPDGYYWCRHVDGTFFVALCEDGWWFVCGSKTPIGIAEEQVLDRVQNSVYEESEG